jgi:hypothetical protein
MQNVRSSSRPYFDHFLCTILTNPPPRALEHADPRAKLAPVLSLVRRRVAGSFFENGTLGVRHESQHSSIGRAHTSDTLRAAVGVEGVALGGLLVVVQVPDRHETLVDESLRGGSSVGRELGATFAVSDDDGQFGAIHAVQED